MRLFINIVLFLTAQHAVAASSPDSVYNAYPTRLSMRSAIETALANSPSIKIGLLNVARADKNVMNAWAEVFPTVSASSNYVRNMEIPVNFLPGEIFGGTPGTLIPVRFGTDNNWQAQVSVTQTLFRGEAIVGISSAALYKSVEEENQRLSAQTVITNTRYAYNGLLLSIEQLVLQSDNVSRLQKNLDDNRKRQKAGYLDEYYVLQLEVELKNETPLLEQAQNAVENAYRQLNRAMGMPAGFRYSVIGDLLTFQIAGENVAENNELAQISQIIPFDAAASPETAPLWKISRGDLRILNASSQLKDREITAYTSRFLPNLSAFYNYTWSAVQPGAPDFSAIASPNDQRARSKTLGVSASVTLFDGLRRNTTVQKARIEKKILLEQKLATEQNAESEIINAADKVLESTKLLPAYDDAVSTARRGYDIAVSRFSKGFGSQIDVTNAQLQLRRAELNRALGAFTYLNAKAGFDLAIGRVPLIDVKN